MINKKTNYIKSRIGYGSADILGGGAYTLTNLQFMFFLTSVEGISPIYAGLIIILAKIWDAISDPIMGVITDRTHSIFGRRRIYFLIGIPLILITFSFLWASWGFDSELAKVIYYTAAYISFFTSFTLVMVPYNALLPDMITDYSERVSYSTIRMIFSTFSSLISATVPSLIIGSMNESNIASGFLLMGIVFAIFYSVPLIFSFVWTNENNNPDENKKTESFSSSFKSLFEALKNKAYRQYLKIFIFCQLGSDMFLNTTLYWVIYVICKDESNVVYITGPALLIALLVLPINNRLAYKFGKHSPSYIILPFRIIGLTIAFFFTKETPMVYIIIVSVICGIGSSASSFVPWTLLADLPDSGYMITGKKTAGVYSSGATFIRKITQGLAMFLTGVILELFGFEKSTEGAGLIIQSESAIIGIKILFIIIPIMLTIIGIFYGIRYNLTKDRHKSILLAIKAKENNNLCIDDEIKQDCEIVSGLKWNDIWVGK